MKTTNETESNESEMICQKIKDKLLNLCEHKFKYYKKNEIIYRENTPADEIYYLREGKVKIFITDSKNEEQITRFVSSGNFFGIKSVVSGKIHLNSSKTIDDTTLCALPRKDFIRVAKEHSDISFYLMQCLSKSSCEILDIVSFLNKSEKERLAYILICLCNKFHTDSIKILKTDLANFSHIEKNKLNPYLSEFKEKKLIHLNSQRIKVCNRNGLIKIASMAI